MDQLQNMLLQQPLWYITRDKERALGIAEDTTGYTIISNIDKEDKSTRELMIERADAVSKGAHVLVFKNTKTIERIAEERGWILLNPPAELAGRIEEKISQYAWLGELVSYLPPTHICTGSDLLWGGEAYIVQFNHAHSGEGTRMISSQSDVDALVTTFPDRPIRVSQFVAGPAFTVNAVVHAGGVLVSSPSYQITGISPFTDNAFATIGNDWGVANIMLNTEQRKAIETMTTEIGMRMKSDGWKGLFGIDVIVEEATGTAYLIEINARQPASTTYESQLQRSHLHDTATHITTYEAHLAALLEIPLDGYTLSPVTAGSQIVQRITENMSTVRSETIATIEQLGCTTRTYANEKKGSELVRIQSTQSCMLKHATLSPLGEDIAHALEQIPN